MDMHNELQRQLAEHRVQESKEAEKKRVNAATLARIQRKQVHDYRDTYIAQLMEEKADVSGSDVMRAMRSVDSTVWVVVSGVCATVFIACVASHRASKLDARPYERYDSYPHDERRPLLG